MFACKIKILGVPLKASSVKRAFFQNPVVTL